MSHSKFGLTKICLLKTKQNSHRVAKKHADANQHYRHTLVAKFK